MVEKDKDNRAELIKTSMGKATFKNFFKTGNQKEQAKVSLKKQIDVDEEQIEQFGQLIKFITIFDSTIAIEEFKKSNPEPQIFLIKYTKKNKLWDLPEFKSKTPRWRDKKSRDKNHLDFQWLWKLLQARLQQLHT